MEQFNILQQKDGTWRFEHGGIILIVDGFIEENGEHKIANPETAIAYFHVKGNVYGVSNRFNAYRTAEEFYDIMKKQYSFFISTVKGVKSKDAMLQQAS